MKQPNTFRVYAFWILFREKSIKEVYASHEVHNQSGRDSSKFGNGDERWQVSE